MFKCSVFMCLNLVVFVHAPNTKHVAAPFNSYPEASIREQNSIRHLWERRSKSLNPRTKNYPKNKVDLLRRILAGSSAKKVATEFERVRSSKVDYVQMSDYD